MRRRSNPKRDGSPTRGESRKGKFLDHLRAIRERGHAAQVELKRLTGKGRAIAGEPVLKADKTPTQVEHPGHFAPEVSNDDKFLQARIEEIEATMKDVRERLRGLDTDSDDDADAAQELSDEMVSLGKQKKELVAAMSKTTVVATNPGGRRRVRRAGRALRGGRAGKKAYAKALRRLCWTLSAIASSLEQGRGSGKTRSNPRTPRVRAKAIKRLETKAKRVSRHYTDGGRRGDSHTMLRAWGTLSAARWTPARGRVRMDEIDADLGDRRRSKKKSKVKPTRSRRTSISVRNPRGSPAHYFEQDGLMKRQLDSERTHRRHHAGVTKSHRKYCRKIGVVPDTAENYEVIESARMLRNRAKSIQAVAQDMPTRSVLRAARAGLSAGSDVEDFARAGVPARHISGGAWKMHQTGQYYEGCQVSADAFKPPVSPKDAISHSRLSRDRRSLSGMRAEFDWNTAMHLNDMGVDWDDLQSSNGLFFPTQRLKRYLDKLPADYAVSDLRRVVKPFLAELKEETLNKAKGTLQRHLPRHEEVSRRPLKGLPSGYREASEDDAEHLAKWCSTSNACLARSYEGEFGDDHIPDRVVLSSEGHVVGLRRTRLRDGDEDGPEQNEYSVPMRSFCTDRDNKAADGEFARFKAARIKHLEEFDAEDDEDLPRVRLRGARRNPTHIDHKSYAARVRGLSIAALRYAIKDAQAAIKAHPHGHKAGYYADEINYCASELTRRTRR